MSRVVAPQCTKHNKQIIYICAFETCKQHRLICQVCKQKETLHFSHHSHYINKLQDITEFNNFKKTVPKLQKGITDCEAENLQHKEFYLKQAALIKEDFSILKKEFSMIADKYEEIYIKNFTKDISKFDQNIQSTKALLKLYSKQKQQQGSFFATLFERNQIQGNQQIQNLIKKNMKAYKVRADIINLKSGLTLSKNNLIEYKKKDEQKRMFGAIQDELDALARSLFDKFKFILSEDASSEQDLKKSIVIETKALSMSRVKVGNLIDYQNDLWKSTASNVSSRSLQRVQLPQLNNVVASVRQKLKPLEPKGVGNIIFQGPFLYSTGVYFGQYQNSERHGWGQFVFEDGTLYQGQWQNDTISGVGRLIRNDCYYEGSVKNGKANGMGNYQDLYRFYSGEWRNDKRHGVGEQQIKTNNKKYIGHFVDDKYNGKGKLITQEYVYEGKFKDGMFHDEGKIKFNNGEFFQGKFKQGQKHIGRHTYPDGSYYDGMFKQNLPSGTGQFYWADGMKYQGNWKQGMQDGVGIQIHQDGKQLKGLWKYGKWEKWL